MSLDLRLNEGFELIVPGDDMDIAGPSRMFNIPADGSYSVAYPLRMTSIGDVPVKVTARTESGYDSLVRKVHVKVVEFVEVRNVNKGQCLFVRFSSTVLKLA